MSRAGLARAAYDADDRFSAELARVYGARACEARYRTTHEDPGVLAAMHEKLRADAALWADRVAELASRG